MTEPVPDERDLALLRRIAEDAPPHPRERLGVWLAAEDSDETTPDQT
jgi:hypothetical protein